MTRAAHDMPYGAELRADGRVRFRLWAPAERAVSVVLKGDRRAPMTALEGGWHELVTDAARTGDGYRFALSDGLLVPDPASRLQADDVNGDSVVIDPAAYRWRNPDWRGRPWREAVIYEAHVGTISPSGDYDGLRAHLPHLVDLGVTALELMPLADFAGRRNWGYDGVLPFAPDRSYGTPEQLKALIDAAHGQGVMVLLDVVYNHFGPEGNYLGRYAPQMFTDKRYTPWGAAIDYSLKPVREFFIHNALYWIEEYRFDGLRLDAVHEIKDESRPTVLEEIAQRVRSVSAGRDVHLILENDDNSALLLARGESGPRLYTAQWNDDFHHAAHVVLTGETEGYYVDYADRPVERLARALAEGFVYQGEHSAYRNKKRGEGSKDLPALAFVNFLQNHDQIGNRARGERLPALTDPAALKCLTAILLLGPAVPLLFMGEEWGAREPFYFFADFTGDLADAVRNGRRQEFARFREFADTAARNSIPDPLSLQTYESSRPDWSARDQGAHRTWLETYRTLLALRRSTIVPRLSDAAPRAGWFRMIGRRAFVAQWTLGDETLLTLAANLDGQSAREPADVTGRVLWATHEIRPVASRLAGLPAWYAGWFIAD